MSQTPERLAKSGRTRANVQPTENLLQDPAYKLALLLRTLPERKTEAQQGGLPEDFYRPRKPSSQIKGFAWMRGTFDAIAELTSTSPQPAAANLHVIFTSGDHWKYLGVPRSKILGLLDAESAGKYFASEIKNHPAYTPSKVSGPGKKADPTPAAE